MTVADPTRRLSLFAIFGSPGSALFAAVVAALAGFGAIYGFGLLSAKAAYWTNPHGDMGQMLAGELAALREPWGLPFGVVTTLTAPDPVSIVYTDSIPWLTAVLKLTHLGPHVSLLGTALLLAWAGQAAAMYALLRACGVERASTLLAGSLLALLIPSFLARQLGHIALSGHALQIAGLALAVHGSRRGMNWHVCVAFTVLGVLAVGVHAYHVPPISLAYLSALVADVLQRRSGALRRAIAAGAAYLAALGAAAGTLGYFVGRGASGGAAALGYYEMNILAPVWPQLSTLAGQKWTGEWFTRTFDPTGGQWYEGLNYLGAGVLLLFGTAIVLAALGRVAPAGARAPRWRRWGPLGAALLLLTLYACGTKGWLGPVQVWTLPLPDRPWMEPLALFRCHGRFFWMVGYAILAWTLTLLDTARMGWGRGALLLAAVFAQAIDVSGIAGALHQRFSRAEAMRAPRGLDSAEMEGRRFNFYPGYFCTTSFLNQASIRQLSLIAQRRHGSSNSAETARAPPSACTRTPPPEALRDAAPGDQTVTVVMGTDGGASEVTNLFARRSDCFGYGVVWVCGRGLARLPGLVPVSGKEMMRPEHIDAVVTLNTPPSNAALVSGWSAPERSGVWSEAPRAVLRLPHPEVPDQGTLVLTLEALSFAPEPREPQRARVSVGGERITEWRLEGGGYHGFQAAIPARLLRKGEPLDIVIDLPDAISPEELTPGAGDRRKLGIGVRSITLAH